MINPFTVYNSVAFSIFAEFSNYHHSYGMFRLLQKEIPHPLAINA